MKKCHFIGIGGIGMSGLARILLSKKIPVTGSDISQSYVTEGLAKEGAEIFIGHSDKYVSENTTIVYSTDIKKDNPEYLAALSLKCPMLHRSDLLLQLMHGYKTLAVAGTHGKTTTTALLASVLADGGIDPSYAVGGIVKKWQSNAGHGNGEYFVAEADESDGTFLKYDSFGAIITNIDLDHMNHFGTEAVLIQSFKEFADKVHSAKHLFWCGDDERLRKLKIKGTSYGVHANNDIRAENIVKNGWETTFDIIYKGKTYPQVTVALLGHHNVLNTLAVFGMALALNVDEKAIRSSLKSFGGVARRAEKKGEVNKILLLDDYAHHPTEIDTTLAGIKAAIGSRKLIAVFQPHRYSRTKDCLGTYGKVFDNADEVIVTDIFAAGEVPVPGLTHEVLMKEIAGSSTIPCRYVPRKELAHYLSKSLVPHDVVATLGAGDITKLSGEILAEWKLHAPKKMTVGVVYGGHSVEHEISLLSARHVISGLDLDLYDVKHFAIDKLGHWMTGADAKQQLDSNTIIAKSKYQEVLPENVMKELLKCDVLIPVLHGNFGEDGTIQGFFEILDKPYTGCDYRSSAISMDKALTKKLILDAGIMTSKFVDFSKAQWKHEAVNILKNIDAALEYPVFVKPVHLGSSIGVQKVTKADQLVLAIEKAFSVDDHILVENGVKGREIEFAVFGDDDVKTFAPGEVFTGGNVYDYESKYGDGGMKTSSQANIPQHFVELGMELAKKAYIAAGCNGMARVDFFFDDRGQYWLNEINPIPGFTKISLFPQICAKNGIDIKNLVDQLLMIALARKRKHSRLLQVL